MGAATLETFALDDIGSRYRFMSIPSNARVAQVLLSCDNLGATGAIDIGIYQTTENGGAVVDADHFASAVLVTSVRQNLDVTFESGVYDLAKIEQPLWQVLGLTADPKRDYDIVATATAATVSAGTITLQVSYAI
jgi:hypothetical protein